MKLKKYFLVLLIISLLIPASVVLAAPNANNIAMTKNGVEFICSDLSTQEVAAQATYTWDVDGGRESAYGRERVWGWSTCTSSGSNVYHYTVSQYENSIGHAIGSSGRVWGSGKVWAWSDWLNDSSAWGLSARVYYGR